MKAKYTINQELDGIEITFASKPEAATLEALKANGYRWHRVKKLWYAKNTAERLSLAKSLADETEATPAADKKTFEGINLDNLGENKPSLYGAELAKAIREDLKRRGVKGCTVRSGRSGYTSSITVTIKAAAEDLASVEEIRKRTPESEFYYDVERHGIYTGEKWLYSLEGYTEEEKKEVYNNYTKYLAKKAPSINTHYLAENRELYNTITTDFYNKVVAVFKIANQWNYNNSDPMTDYFDIGYYLDIDVKTPDGYEPRENMTEEEKTAYNAEQEAKRKAAEEAAKKYEEERKAAEKAAAEYKAWSEAARAGILENIKILDLDEKDQLYFTGLISGCGKEASLEELRQSIEEGCAHYGQDAQITRKVIFTSEKALADFEKMFLHDFDFLAGKGGTGSDDVRLINNEIYNQLTQDQRETIKFYMTDCVAIYFNNELRLVIDPEGFSYARYVCIPTDETETRNASEEAKAQEEESKTKNPFYIPEPVTEQAAALHKGQQVTIYQTDGWIINNIYAGAGTIEEIKIADYAQYKNALYIDIVNNGKKKTVIVRDNKDCLIYEGIQPALPDEITGCQISERMRELYNADVLLPNTYNYYKKQGKTPIIDTCHR